ncbi:hypothetical protein B0H14DRAFT_2345926, partial [Mycena olivaceomarginata]
SLVLLALAVKPFPHRALFFLPIPPLTAYVLRSTTGNFNAEYVVGLMWLLLFWFASDYILLTDVQRTLRRVPPNRTTAPKEIIENASLWHRTRWAVVLLNSPRGVGWTHEPTVLPAHSVAGTSRAVFIVQRLWKALQLFIIHDASNLHQRWNPMFTSDGPGWRADGWMWRAIVVTGWCLSSYSIISLVATAVNVVNVACGLWRPEEWPPFFGSPADAYTIRRLWG